MTDKQIAKQNMLRVTLLTLDEHAPLYAGVPAFVKTVDDLKVVVKEIEKEADLQSGLNSKGATSEKNESEVTLVNQTVMVANALWVMASDKNDVVLLPKVKVTKSMMYSPHNTETLSIARRIHAEALARAGAMSEYGVSPEVIYTLETSIARYEHLIAAPRAAITELKQATWNIARLFARTDTLLNDRLDKLMSLFKQSEPDFYAVYFNARNIINTSLRHRKPTEDETIAKTEA
jgi:hypothetical protein